MNGEKFNSNNDHEQEQEQENLQKHKNKLIGFYLSDGDEKYIFSGRPEFSSDHVTPGVENAVLEMMKKGHDFSSQEKRLLDRIAGPDFIKTTGSEKGTDVIFDGSMADDKHQKRILAYMTGGSDQWDNFDKMSGDDVAAFLKEYPTPLDFEKISDGFVEMIEAGNGREKGQEYREAMEDFKYNVYGKKYEYFKAMKELHREADELTLSELGIPTEGEVKSFEKIFGREVIKDAYCASLNKGDLIGQPDRKNEDKAYCDPDNALFGVFDGAGGERGAAQASGLSASMLNSFANYHQPENADDLRNILIHTNEVVSASGEAGLSTAVLGKVVERKDGKSLIWASVGDSRIYVARGDQLHQLTRDEGQGNVIYNAIGMGDRFRIEQAGEFRLRTGDRIVLCSDGITGDYEEDFIPDDEFLNIVRNAKNAEDASRLLINRATKRDDRTALVFEI